MHRALFGLLGAVACLSGGLVSSTVGQEVTVSRPYDGIQAGLDAFRLAEEQRQAGVANQLNQVDQARFYSGYPTSRGATIYYGYLSPQAAYAYGYGPSPVYSSAGLYSGGFAWNGVWPPTTFAPWPFLPGDIYGYPLGYLPARQPVGKQQVQTGANRWESHPVYDPPLTPYTPLPPVDSPYLHSTPYATLRPAASDAELIPPPPSTTLPAPAAATTPLRPAESARRGPREY